MGGGVRTQVFQWCCRPFSLKGPTLQGECAGFRLRCQNPNLTPTQPQPNLKQQNQSPKKAITKMNFFGPLNSNPILCSTGYSFSVKVSWN